MKQQLDKILFERYFFYGLENKDEIVKRIILNSAKDLASTQKDLDIENEKTNYEKNEEIILKLIVQLERFTSLHDDAPYRKYFYDKLDTDSMQVHQMFNRNIEKLEKTGAISAVKYRPVSGIYFNTHGYSDEVRQKYGKFSGQQLLQEFNEKSKWTQEVYDILCYLQELEEENKFEYYSLFLDSKYARAIHRNRKEITDDREIHEIKNVYRKFLKSRQVSGVDIKLEIKSPINEEMLRYIDEHYPEYDTITTLKADAMNENYKRRVKQEIEKVCNMFLKEKDIEK